MEAVLAGLFVSTRALKSVTVSFIIAIVTVGNGNYSCSLSVVALLFSFFIVVAESTDLWCNIRPK